MTTTPLSSRFEVVYPDSDGSPMTKSDITDRGIKKGLYAYLGVSEYFQYDPTADYLSPSLQGFRLMGENYLPIASPFVRRPTPVIGSLLPAT